MNILNNTKKKIKDTVECIKKKYNNISNDEKIKDKTKKYINNTNKVINEIFSFIKNNVKNKPITTIILSLTLGLFIGFSLKKK